MQNGTRVKWTSLTGKTRSGTFIMHFHATPLVMVIGDWDGKVHKIRSERLVLYKTKTKDEVGAKK